MSLLIQRLFCFNHKEIPVVNVNDSRQYYLQMRTTRDETEENMIDMIKGKEQKV